jgi:hypothetical protein
MQMWYGELVMRPRVVVADAGQPCSQPNLNAQVCQIALRSGVDQLGSVRNVTDGALAAIFVRVVIDIFTKTLPGSAAWHALALCATDLNVVTSTLRFCHHSPRCSIRPSYAAAGQARLLRCRRCVFTIADMLCSDGIIML